MQDVAARQHHRQRLHPRPHRPVLEGGRAGRIRRHGSADCSAEICGDGRQPDAISGERFLELVQRDACADNHAIRCAADSGETFRAEDEIARRRGAAGQRGLRADGEETRRLPHGGRGFRRIVRPRNRDRMSAGIVRGVLEILRDEIGIVLDVGRGGRWRDGAGDVHREHVRVLKAESLNM